MAMSKEAFLKSAGLKGPVVDVWIAQEWLVPEQTPSGPRFREIDIARARLILELRAGLGANDAGIDVILHLMDQLHGMRQALDALRRHVGENRD